jgi:hypothetical protein
MDQSRFYMFVDDDYYVSSRNLLRFLRNPINYPRYLGKKSSRRCFNQGVADPDLLYFWKLDPEPGFALA